MQQPKLSEKDVELGPPRQSVENGAKVGGVDRASMRDDFIAEANKRDMEYNLPGTGSRTATWIASTYHNITAMVGAGVLGLPAAFVYLTWGGGIVVLVGSWFLTLYTLWQLVTLHEHKGLRFNRYHELSQYCFGPKLGKAILLPPQLIVMVGLGITYSVTGGSSLKRIWDFLCNEPCKPFGLSAWIIVFIGMQLFLSQTPNFNALTVVSLAAAVMSLSYSTIAFGASVHEGRQPGAQYNLDGFSKADGVLGCFNALGVVAFAYGGHNVVLEIQATMPSPSYKGMMRGVYLAYIVVAWCYFSVAISGYAAFGNKVGSNILLTIGHPKWLLVMANFMVVIHVLGSFQVYTMPVFDMIEEAFARRRINLTTLPWRLFYRSFYVVLVGFVACSIPFFGDLLGFIGALGTGPTTFWYPSIFYLVIKRPGFNDKHFWASWICIVLGVLITVLGAIGGLRGIIKDASSYHFYS